MMTSRNGLIRPGAKFFIAEIRTADGAACITFYDTKQQALELMDHLSRVVVHPIADLPDLFRPEIDEVIAVMRDKPLADRMAPRNKYDREIVPGLWVDVYDVLDAFKVTRSAVAHAVKKLLAPGQRGVKDELADLKEARDSIDRAIQKLDEWV